MRKLTQNQALVLEKMIGYLMDNNRLPTTDWVNKSIGVQSSTPTLRRIEARGYIKRAGDNLRIGRWIPVMYPDGSPVVFKYEFFSTFTPQEWLKKNQRDAEWLAEGVEVEVSKVQKWLDGSSHPTVVEAADVERFTLGGIPIRCWVGVPSMQRQGELI